VWRGGPAAAVVAQRGVDRCRTGRACRRTASTSTRIRATSRGTCADGRIYR